MKISRHYTAPDMSPYAQFQYEKRSSILRNTDGSVVFQSDEIEVPVSWSQVATDILAQKYFRKTGVPQQNEKGEIILGDDSKPVLGSESSIKQVAHRMAGAWKFWGEKYNYFDSEEDAQAFYDELVYMLLAQMAAPNSPQWFNTGLNWAYGITGSKQGHYYVDPETKEIKTSDDAYSRPQPHACFIQSIKDDLVNEGGIFDLAVREARIFKYGSGTGTNFSPLRGSGEKLSGGGVSSGLMSFLKIYDRAAGAIKSGGTTRRAAKMVIVDIDHPDVEEFIEWKAREEAKVAALAAGSKINSTFLQAICDEALKNGTDFTKNKKLNGLIINASHRGVSKNYIYRVLSLVDQGFTNLNFEVFDSNYEGEAYLTVSGQNSNNSVRVSNEFMKAVENDLPWELKWRTNKAVAKAVKARDLWNKINLAAWKSADPGLQYDTTINEWHTCPKSGRINASNPCSEYMFLDDSACNLASLNLVKFYDEENGKFLVDSYLHAVRLWTIVLEISVLMAQFPSKKIAETSFNFRTLGLGFANLGSLLMIQGLPYDSKEGTSFAAAISSMMTAQCYNTSAEMAKELGPFEKYTENKNDMLRVIRNHRRAAYNTKISEYEKLTIRPTGIDPKYCPKYLVEASKKTWDQALENGEKFGFRNAQVTVIAPTGTIGLVMDCDTTGIEPDFAVVKFKKLSGGGYFKIVNQSVKKALKRLEYTDNQIKAIEMYCKGNGTLKNCPAINLENLRGKGFNNEKLNIIEKQLKNVFDIKFAFNKWSLGEDFLISLGFKAAQYDSYNFNMLSELGYSDEEIEQTNDYVCGTMMLEGAPFIKEEHLSIFDTANKCGKNGTRYIDYMAHVRMMAAVQPFISGAISKTVNMPAEATVSQIGEVYMTSWKMMLKAIALYRDGSKLSQPLNSATFEGIDDIILLDDTFADDSIGAQELHKKITEKIVYEPRREKLPKKRSGFIREAYVGGHKVFLRTGEYEDGKLGEIFIDMYKEGASFRGLLNSFAILTSKALQYGIPLDELVDTFTFTRFDPAGVVQGHDAIKYATSILDYVFRSLGYDYLERQDFVHVKAVDEDHNHNHAKLQSVAELVQENEPENTLEPEINTDSNDDLNAEDESSYSTNTEEPAHKKSDNMLSDAAFINEAKQIGYTGEQCENCGSIRVKRNGSCTVCEDCGTTTGCS